MSRVLGFGTYDLSKHPRAGIVLDGLRAHGDDVAVVNAPLGISTRERVAMVERPWLGYRFVLRLLRRWATLVGGARRERRSGGRFDAVVVGYLGHFDVLLARLLFPRTPIVLDMLIFGADTARDRGVSGGMKLRLLDLLDRIAVRCSTLVLLDTDEARELMPAKSQHKAVVVAVGAAQEWFDAADPSRSRADNELTVAFFGLYTPLQGAPVIGQALAELAHRPDIAVTMIGSGQDYEATRAAATANTSTTWIDWVESSELPAVVAAHDVCLGIFGDGPKARRVVPNKVYEGAAAGCVIVTSDTEPQRRAFGDAAVLVPPSDPAALAEALVELRDDPDRVDKLRQAAHTLARDAFTAAQIVLPLRARLTDGHPAAS